jgi:hypothetical protein
MVDLQIIGGGILSESDLDKMNTEEVKTRKTPLYTFAVTGTLHGSIVYAKSEGDARRAFHKCYNGESITHIRLTSYPA